MRVDEHASSSANICLPHLRRLKFCQLFDHRLGLSTVHRRPELAEKFISALGGFLEFRSGVYYWDVDYSHRQDKGHTHILETLELESSLHDHAVHLKDFARHLVWIPDWKLKTIKFHDLEVPRPDDYDADATWDEMDYTGDDDGPRVAGLEDEDDEADVEDEEQMRKEEDVYYMDDFDHADDDDDFDL
jgi:hypothetical protein